MRLLAFVLSLCLSCVAFADTRINVVGLFSGKAMLAINGGKPKTYSAGQTTPEGVRIVSADSNRVVVEVDGKRRELAMGQGMSIGGIAPTGPQSATLYGNHDGHFIGDGYINGTPIKFLVDTGATTVAMSSIEARRIGLNYQNGQAGAASTAGGVVPAYRVSLNSIRVGSIELYQVDAMVLEGNAPPIVLLGMTVLNRVQMQRDGMVMTLTKKY